MPRHRNPRVVARIAAITLVIAIAVDASGPPFFQGLGALPGSRFGSFARDISSDGSAVTGNSDQANIGGSTFMAYRWKAGTMTPLGDLTGGSNLSESGGISADGSVCGGMSFSSNGTEAFRWVNGVMEPLGDLPGGEFYSHGFDVSGDGTTVIGISRTEIPDFPFRWRDGVMTNISLDFPGSTPTGLARAVNHDGNVIVGVLALSPSPPPFRWTPGLMQTLDLPPAAQWGTALAVSPDGLKVAGVATYSDVSREAFLWESGVTIGLSDLPGGDLDSQANGVSDTGVVVGVGETASTGPIRKEAFIWTADSGIRRLRDRLTDDFGLDLTGWVLSEANGVSADGLTIAGSGTNPLGKAEAWIAHLGCIPGDTNNDGACSPADIDRFIACLLTGHTCGCADVNGDGSRDGRDISALVACISAGA